MIKIRNGMTHTPVLLKEVLHYLNPKPNENFVDCTVGGGGHAKVILEKNKPKGQVLGIEWDEEIYLKTIKNFENQKRLILINDSYKNLKEILERENFKPVHGILADLGMSSWHVDASQKGFTFAKNQLLDMRYNLENTLTASKIINDFEEEEIEKVLSDFGEERFARKIAQNIMKERKKKRIESTFELKEIIEKSFPPKFRRGKINPSTLVFQGLRIAVNDELGNLKQFLPQALDALEDGGRLAVISFHSLEDRIVKNFFKEKEGSEDMKVLTKKPVTASAKEVAGNRRARSAKLRVAVKAA